VQVVSAAKGAAGTEVEQHDALSWYDSEFRNLGISNDSAGVDSLRHTYALLIGLGMRESSGKYCAGRDKAADFDAADTAEAGAFQASWGASRTNATLPALLSRYSSDQSGCLLDIFRQGVTCSAWDAKTWGGGTGALWQRLTKNCPAFAAEYAAVLLRSSGGSSGEFGPLRNKKVELRRECDVMFAEIQHRVRNDPQICSSF
jgi:hypothetical protein